MIANATQSALGASTIDQNVHIEAEFPNASNAIEIENAMMNLVNRAAQFAHRSGRI